MYSHSPLDSTFAAQRSRVDRQGESEANEKKPVDEEEEKLKVTQKRKRSLRRRLPTQTRREAGLVRTGRLFGGLVNDIKRKKPHYLSDFRWQNVEREMDEDR